MTLTDWKSLEITQIIFEELRSRVEQLKDELAAGAGNDPLSDRYKCGLIAAWEEVIKIHLEETHGN